MKLDDTVMVQFLGSLSNHTASRSWIRKRQGNFQRRKKVPGRLKKRTGAVKPTSVQDGDRTFWMHVRHQPDKTGTALYTGNKGWNTNPKTGKRNRGR